MNLSAEHLDELGEARRLLERMPFLVKATNLLGSPIEKGIEILPAAVQGSIAKATTASLEKALEWAVRTMDVDSVTAYPRLHMAAVAVSGAVGGAFGLPALLVEVPFSTMVMLRSIADIARANGERLTDIETRLQCLSVFSLGGASRGDDAAETGYYAVRASLASLVTEAAAHLAGKHAGERLTTNIPALLTLIARIGARFNIQVSEKAMAQLVPIAGAAGGAIINTLFIDHFQDVSRGHFTVRRLERQYGEAAVRRAWQDLESP